MKAMVANPVTVVRGKHVTLAPFVQSNI